jgi:hypothetical protein
MTARAMCSVKDRALREKLKSPCLVLRTGKELLEQELRVRRRREFLFYPLTFSYVLVAGMLAGVISSVGWRSLQPGMFVEPFMNGCVMGIVVTLSVGVSIIGTGLLGGFVVGHVGGYPYVKSRPWPIVIAPILNGLGVFLTAKGTFWATSQDIQTNFGLFAVYFFIAQVLLPAFSGIPIAVGGFGGVCGFVMKRNKFMGDINDAIRADDYNQAMDIALAHSESCRERDPVCAAITLDKLAEIHLLMKNWKQAQNCVNKSFEVWQSLANKNIIMEYASEKARKHFNVLRFMDIFPNPSSREYRAALGLVKTL